MRHPKPQRIRDQAVLDVARGSPCAACGAPPPSDPAHVRSRGAGGDDVRWNVIPLCRRHHQEQHAVGWATMSSRWPGIAQWLTANDRGGID